MIEDITGGRGVRVGNELLAFVGHDERIRPLRDQIVIEPLPLDHGTSLEVVYQGKPVRGRILAVGPGRYPIRYNGRKGQRTKSWDSKRFRPCDLKVGDIVDIGGLELGGYLFTRVIWGDKDVVICREEDVAVVVEADTSWALGDPDPCFCDCHGWPESCKEIADCPTCMDRPEE